MDDNIIRMEGTDNAEASNPNPIPNPPPVPFKWIAKRKPSKPEATFKPEGKNSVAFYSSVLC